MIALYGGDLMQDRKNVWRLTNCSFAMEPKPEWFVKADKIGEETTRDWHDCLSDAGCEAVIKSEDDNWTFTYIVFDVPGNDRYLEIWDHNTIVLAFVFVRDDWPKVFKDYVAPTLQAAAAVEAANEQLRAANILHSIATANFGLRLEESGKERKS